MITILTILSFAGLDYLRGRDYVPRLYVCLAMAFIVTGALFTTGMGLPYAHDLISLKYFLYAAFYITMTASLYFGYTFADSKFFSASTGNDNRKEPGTFLGNLFANLIMPNPVTKANFRKWGIAGMAGGHIQKFSFVFITLFGATGSIVPLIVWPLIGLSGFIYGAGRYDPTGTYRFVEPARGALL